MPSLIGNKPNQVPTNGDLGRLAFMDNLDSFTSKTVMDTDITNIAPSLSLDFANSKVLDPRITFTRASTATFYNGVSSAVAEQNLLLHTENWGNAVWQSASSGGGVGGIKTPNFGVAPDGTTTACRIQLDVSAGSVGAQSQIYQNYATSAVLHTSSCWIKTNDASTKTIMGFSVSSSTPTTLTVTGTWQRLTATRTNAGATDNFQIILINGTTSSTADLLVWYPQAEQRSAVTAYTPTTTAAITNYIPTLSTAAAGVARFDHNPVTGESLGLLIEEQRVNLATYSADLSNAAWTKTNTTITADTIVAPDGTLTGDKILENATNAAHTIYDSFSVTSGTAYTYSGYFKAGERSIFQIACYAVALVYTAEFDLNALTVTNRSGTGSATITAVGNGWYRCTATMTATSTASGAGIQINLCSAANTASYAGNTFFGIYAWGFQAEAGSFATSYIPTVASQVTRSPDAASMTGTNFSSWYNPSEGTVYVDSQMPTSGANTVSLVGAGTNITRLGGGKMDVFVAGTQVAQLISSVSTGLIRHAGAYKANDFAISANGQAVVTDSIGAVPTVTSLEFTNGVGVFPNSTIKKFTYYPRRLPNSELVEMTA